MSPWLEELITGLLLYFLTFYNQHYSFLKLKMMERERERERDYFITKVNNYLSTQSICQCRILIEYM